MKVPKLLRGTPAAGEGEQPRRRRRRGRADGSAGPMSIVPIVDDRETPSWLKTPPASPMELSLDAARERLRRDIPPVDDDL